MPQVIKIGPYVIYFWLDEGRPLEPVRAHRDTGAPAQCSCLVDAGLHRASNSSDELRCGQRQSPSARARAGGTTPPGPS